MLQLVEFLQPALCEECSRFRKITRGESLTFSECCITNSSYQFTTESRLGGTAAVFKPEWWLSGDQKKPKPTEKEELRLTKKILKKLQTLTRGSLLFFCGERYHG